MCNSNKYLVAPVWISYAERETTGKRASQKDNECYARYAGENSTKTWTCFIVSHHHTVVTETNIKTIQLSFIPDKALLIPLDFPCPPHRWKKDIRLAQDCYFDCKMGGFKVLRCAQERHLNIKEEKNTNHSSLFQ